MNNRYLNIFEIKTTNTTTITASTSTAAMNSKRTQIKERD